MRLSLLQSVLLLALSVTNASPASAQDADSPLFDAAAEVLAARCLQCHNPEDHRGDFSVHTRAALVDSGNVDLEDPLASQLLDSVVAAEGEKPSMPKDAKPLTKSEVDALRKWLEAGMPWPEGQELEPPAVRDFDHWSLRPMANPNPPTVEDAEARQWIRTPTDAFILRALRSQQLSPSSEADRRTLIRRVTFDLIGLPPTPAEVDDFLDDRKPDAYRRLVDRLLASPRYGERWGRHWLDVAKYADTCGYDKDKLRPNAWPYRDYVIRSFNLDKPFGRFAEEQIAGDVLYPGALLAWDSSPQVLGTSLAMSRFPSPRSTAGSLDTWIGTRWSATR